MNWEEYVKLASRTDAELSTKFEHDVHMIMGMMTESTDLLSAICGYRTESDNEHIDWVNVEEEIGDFFWYVANFSKQFQDFHVILYGKTSSRRKPVDISILLVLEISEMLDIMKKNLAYKKEIKWDDIVSILDGAIDTILKLCEVNNLDIEKILKKNIEKLQVRYPQKFSSEKANDRDLRAERKILEKQ